MNGVVDDVRGVVADWTQEGAQMGFVPLPDGDLLVVRRSRGTIYLTRRGNSGYNLIGQRREGRKSELPPRS